MEIEKYIGKTFYDEGFGEELHRFLEENKELTLLAPYGFYVYLDNDGCLWLKELPDPKMKELGGFYYLDKRAIFKPFAKVAKKLNVQYFSVENEEEWKVR